MKEFYHNLKNISMNQKRKESETCDEKIYRNKKMPLQAIKDTRRGN